MLKWHCQFCAVLLLLTSRNSSVAVDGPVVPPPPDFIPPKPFQAKDAADGCTLFEKEESPSSTSAARSKNCFRGRSSNCSWGSTKEAISVFMNISPSVGTCELRPVQVRSDAFLSRATAMPIAAGKTILGVANVTGNLSVPPLLDASRPKGPDADVIPPLVVGLVNGDGPPATEDMPSFNEWARKRLEEQAHPVKGPVLTAKNSRHKNYASVDCGAKVLDANAESQSASAVLSHDQDDYMLNPCTARAWLVLELCEAVQLERLQLANFELFSSSPRHFNVFSSDRYPTREWNVIGAFEAADEKTAQSFWLQQTSFSKYIKVEMVSHYGAEHYCPLSLIRVYGTSEYEALDTEEQPPDEQGSSEQSSVVFDAGSDYQTTPASVASESKNLFGSAKEAVLTIVKKAAEALTSKNHSKDDAGRREQKTIDKFSDENCRCLQRVPSSECQSPAPVGSMAGYNQTISEKSLALLACDYDRLSVILNRWHPSRGHFVRSCSYACSPYVGSAKLNATTSGRDLSKCMFYAAVLRPERFGALCHLDKLMLDGGTPSDLPLVLSTKICRTSVESTEVPPTTIPVSASSDAIASSDVVSVVTSSMSSSRNVESPSSMTSMIETDISDEDVVVTAKNAEVPEEPLDSYQQILRPTPSIEQYGGRETDASGSQRIESSSVGREDRGTEQNVLSDASVSSSAAHSEDKASLAKVIESSSASTASLNSSRMPEELKPVASQLEPQEGMPPVVTGGQTTLEASNGSPSVSNVAVDDAAEPSASAIPMSTQSSNSGSQLSWNASTETARPSAVLPSGFVGGGGGAGSVLSPAQKESVFVRLSNRIKALELNMSLSSQYLEELSRRYRKQMEEMQRAFNKTISALNETARMAHERDLRQQEMIALLQKQVDQLTLVVTSLAQQQESLHSQVIARHLVLMMVEIVVMMALFLTCFRPGVQPSRLESLSSAVVDRISRARTTSVTDAVESPILFTTTAAERPSYRRRNSESSLTGLSPSADRRRPSSEALNVSGTYSDLLIVEPTIPIWVDRPLLSNVNQARKSKRKKHRNKGNQGFEGLYRSVSNDALTLKPPMHPNAARKGSIVDVSSAGLLFDDSSVSRIVNMPISKDCEGSSEKNVGGMTASEETRPATTVVQLQRRPPVPPLKPRQSFVVSKSQDVNGGSGYPLTLPLSCHQSFNLKETASLAASSLVYGYGSDKEHNG